MGDKLEEVASELAQMVENLRESVKNLILE